MSEQDTSLDQVNESILDAKSSEDTEQYLTFYMKDEEFGVNILSVQEIRGWEEVTPIPNSPDQVKGVMNLRGTIVPIIDFRMCFGISDLRYTEETVVIILVVKTDTNPKVMGIVVDAVSDVHNFSADDIQPSPDLAHQDQAQYVMGLGRTDDKMVILLELSDELINSERHPESAEKELVEG